MNTAVGVTGLHCVAGNRVQRKDLSGYDCRSYRCPDGRKNLIPISLKFASGIIFDKTDGFCFFNNRKVTASRTHSGGDCLGYINRANPGILRMVFVTDKFSDILIIDFAGITCIKRGADFTNNSFTTFVISGNQCWRYSFVMNIHLPHIKALDLIHIRFNHTLQSAFIRHKLTVTGASQSISLIAAIPPYCRINIFLAECDNSLIITGSKGMTQVVSN